MKAGEIREMTEAEIAERLEERREELFRLRFRRATQELENPQLVKELKRDVARMKTILRERELAQASGV